MLQQHREEERLRAKEEGQQTRVRCTFFLVTSVACHVHDMSCHLGSLLRNGLMKVILRVSMGYPSGKPGAGVCVCGGGS